MPCLRVKTAGATAGFFVLSPATDHFDRWVALNHGEVFSFYGLSPFVFGVEHLINAPFDRVVSSFLELLGGNEILGVWAVAAHVFVLGIVRDVWQAHVSLGLNHLAPVPHVPRWNGLR